MSSLKDSKKERLFYIEYLALFTGQVSRKDLVNRFGISDAAATKDISNYVKLAPEFLNYDLRKKKYIATDITKRHFESHDVEQSLYSLAGERTVTEGIGCVKLLSNRINNSIIKTQSLEITSIITRCIFQNKQITAKYYSMDKGNKERTLSPLGLIHDGMRWIIRCFDHDSDKFKDYNLERFTKVEYKGTSKIQLSNDEEWNANVTVKLIPHPNAEHPETILKDFIVTANNIIELKLKVCQVGFFLRFWNVDCTTDARMDPEFYQLYLSNRDELSSNGVSKWSLDNQK